MLAVPSILPIDYFTANNYIVGPDVGLTGADLTGADLTSATLTGSQYDEFTTFPSGDDYLTPLWGLDGGIEPWNAGMVPVPEPSLGSMLIFGTAGLIGLAAMKRTR